MDKLKNDIQNTLKIQEETTKQMMCLVLNHTSSDETNDIITEDSNELSESDNEGYEIIEYKGKDYILEEDKIYNINDDKTKGKLYGSYIDKKVKKIKSKEMLDD